MTEAVEGGELAKRRYCENCATIFDTGMQKCPECGAAWSYSPPSTRRDIARALSFLAAEHERGGLADAAFALLRQRWEAELVRLAPPRRVRSAPLADRPPLPQMPPPPRADAVPVQVGPTSAQAFQPVQATHQPAMGLPSTGASVVAPPRGPPQPLQPPGPPIAEAFSAWAAKRQADILLYLGAFLLSVSALIFVAYQGNAVNGAIRFATLATYTLGFLGLGLSLHRWERVQEAGPVFLAVGALLVPVDFIAMRTQVFDQGQVSSNLMWLFGSATSGVLYLTLAGRGFGRYYVAPAVPAALIAWGALGSVLNLPNEWLGAWYEVVAIAVYVAAVGAKWRAASGPRTAALIVGGWALAASHLITFGEAIFDNLHHGPLPVTYALAIGGMAAALWRERTTFRMAAVATLVSPAALSVAWAIFDLHAGWWGGFGALSAAGYLIATRFDRPERARSWGGAALVSGGAMILVTQAGQLAGGASPWPMPLTYGLILVGAAATFWRWGWAWREAAAVIPAACAILGLTAAIAQFDLQPEWWGLFVVAGATGYLLLAHFDSEPFSEYWRQVAAGGALLGIAIAHVAVVLVVSGNHYALPAVYALATTAATATFVRWRFGWLIAPAAMPALAAAFAISLAWAINIDSIHWAGLWVAAVAVGYLALAEADAERRTWWRGAAAASLVAGLLWQHGVAIVIHGGRWPLPLAYAVAVAAAAWDGTRRQDAGVFVGPVIAAVAGAATLWAFGLGREWWCFPSLAVAAAIIATSPWWPDHKLVGRFGWSYALILACAPTLISLPAHFASANPGLEAQLISAGLVAVIAIRSQGSIALLLSGLSVGPDDPALAGDERTGLFLVSIAFLFACLGSTNSTIGVTGGERSWIYAAAGSLGWAVLAIRGRRSPRIFDVLAPGAVAAFGLAGALAYIAPGIATLIFTLGAAGPALAFPSTRRWLLWVLAQGFAFAALWGFWAWRDLDIVFLPPAYAAAAVAAWLGLAQLRSRVDGDLAGKDAVDLLSWGPWLLSAGLAALLLGNRDANLEPREMVVGTREWASAATVLAAASSAVAAEGWRLRRRAVWVAATVGLMVALLMGIATRQPENVQAYSIPLGLYVIALSFTWRSTPALFPPHMALHEGLMVGGALILVFPPASQSFASANYGFELIGMALAFLAVGLSLRARWLVPCGVLTLSGVAFRWLTGGFIEVPFWLVLGVLGTLLIAIGMLVLLQRERWDRLRSRLARWWLEVPPVAG